MNFAPGNHTAEPKGDVRRYREPDLKLLHCSFLTPEYRLAKVRRIRARQSDVNRRYGWSFQYDDSDEAAMAKYRKLRRKAVPLILQDSQYSQPTRWAAALRLLMRKGPSGTPGAPCIRTRPSPGAML
jgi:hypothetical protein